jgi:hypothetical protein
MKTRSFLNFATAAVASLALVPACSAQAQLAGDWQGTLEVSGATIHVVWHAVAASDGTITSTFDNPDEGLYGIKVKTVALKGSNLTMMVDDTPNANGQVIAIRGNFEGVVSADGNEANGTWTQSEPAQPPMQVHFKRAAAQAAASGPTIAGDWAGTLDAGGAQLRLVLHISTSKDGTLAATLDSIDQGANAIPVKSATLKDGTLELDVAAVNGTYKGTINKDTSEIAGTWTQGQTLPLNFKRAQPETAAKPASPTDIDGTWTGKLETPSAMLTINLKIANMDTGLTAQLQSPDQASNWAPATSIKRDGDKLTVVFSAFGATYEGKVSADRTTIDGKFTQAGNELPLVLKKS